MRIGLITGEYPPMRGGIADYTAILAQQMVAAGHDVFVLTNPAAQSQNDGVRVCPTVSNWNRAYFGAVNAWAEANALDVINLQYQTAAFNMAGLLHFLPRRFRSIPFITTFHDLRFPYLFPKAGPLRPWIVRALGWGSAGCIVTNRGDEARLQKEVKPRCLARIPLGTTVKAAGGMSAARRGDVRRGLGVEDDTLVIAHFGMVNAVKGVDTLLGAAALARKSGVSLQILMIGERVGASDPTNHAYAQSIDALADELGLPLTWTGYVEDSEVGEYFAAADVVALPFQDGASLRRTSLQAALAHGCAVITTTPTDDPLPEFRDGEHLLYVPPGDAEALARAFGQLAADSGLRAKLRAGALEASRQFAWPEIAAQILAFYQRVKLGAC
jgi:glycosyltransferase involved in cell wall biosynthesis